MTPCAIGKSARTSQPSGASTGRIVWTLMAGYHERRLPDAPRHADVEDPDRGGRFDA